MKTLILGAKGMLAQDLKAVFSHYSPVLRDKDELDITNEKQVKEKISQLKPDLILNSAAYTNVEQAETEKDLAFKVNAKAVCYLAETAKNINAVLVHFSTDYVFDGKKQSGYNEANQPQHPSSVYGQSKLAGEKQILSYQGLKYYLVRISWLFGPSNSRKYKNFVETILKKAQTEAEIKVVQDQFGKPCFTKDVAENVLALIEKQAAFGIYHLPNEPQTTWYDFAKAIIKTASQKTKIIPCQTSDFKSKVKRPKYSILLNTKVPLLRHWEKALEEYLCSPG